MNVVSRSVSTRKKKLHMMGFISRVWFQLGEHLEITYVNSLFQSLLVGTHGEFISLVQCFVKPIRKQAAISKQVVFTVDLRL